jgi:hypothetical protein
MIKFSDVQDAFFFVSSGGYGSHTAVIARDTGEMYWRSEEGDLDDIGDKDLPSDRCIELPHRNELGLGQDLVFEFVAEQAPDELEHVKQMFRSRGAYSAFKDLMSYRGLLQRWYDFEQKREERALREWCEENELEVSS